jgi:predicted transcriptional regulator
MSTPTPPLAPKTDDKRRAELQQAAMRAWREFEVTGLHISAAEADAWLAKLERGEAAEPPASHR